MGCRLSAELKFTESSVRKIAHISTSNIIVAGMSKLIIKTAQAIEKFRLKYKVYIFSKVKIMDLTV